MFGDILRELRLARGWERSILAEKASLSYESIRRYEDEKRRPDHESVVKLARVLGAHTLRYLLEAAGYSTADIIEPPEEAALSLEEREALEVFRSLSPADQVRYLRIGRSMLPPEDAQSSSSDG